MSSSRSARFFIRLLAALVGGLIASFAIATWWLSTNPLDTTFLTPTIEKAIDHYLPYTHTQIASTLTRWDNIEHMITLRVEDLKVSDGHQQIIASIPHMDMQISLIGLLAGKFLPLGLNIEHPQIKLIRDTNGVLRFGGIGAGNNQSVASQTDTKSAVAAVLDDWAAAYQTRMLLVSDTVLDVHDDKTQSDWAVHVPEIRIEHAGQKLSGHALLNVTQQDKISTLQVAYDYDRSQSQHRLQTQLTDIIPAFFAGGHPGTLGLDALKIVDLPLTGKVTTVFDSSLNLVSGSVDVLGGTGFLNYPDFWEQPRAIKSLSLKADYDRNLPQIATTEAMIDFGGPTLDFNGSAKPATIAGHDADFAFDIQIDRWPMNQFGGLWPKPIIPNPRIWIATNMSKGMFEHGEASFKGALSWNDLDNVDITEGSGSMLATNGRIDYLDGLTPVEGVNANARFDLNQMTVDVSGGGIGALRIVPFTVTMTDFEKDIQNIIIPLKFAGPLPDVLNLINAPRLGYASALGLTPNGITGNATGMVELRFPLLNDVAMKDVAINGNALLTSVASSELIKKIAITQGNLTLALDKNGLGIKGTANLNNLPAQIMWQENFEAAPSKNLREGTITGVIGNDQWKILNIDSLHGTRGPVLAKVAVQQVRRDSPIILSDNFDLTGAEIHVDQLNWWKPARMPALLKATVEIPHEGPIKIKNIDLSGPQINVKGSALLQASDGSLQKLRLDPFILGRSNALLNFEETDDDDHSLHFDIEGQSFDVSGLKGGHDVAASDPRSKEYNIHVAKLYTSATGFIDKAEGYAIRDPQGWDEIDLQGMADGDTPLSVNLTRKDGIRIFNANSDDFGKALKGLGMTDTIIGGKITIAGQSTLQNPRDIDGTVKADAFTVKGLPALVMLLNATSPFGFQNILSGKMDFDRLKGSFHWHADEVDLKEMHLVGSIIGMDIAGPIDMNEGTANLYGVVAPFSLINRVLGSIPFIGDMLTGGEGGGLFAVAYKITGDLNNPRVVVNPASLLTPGFVRNLFFGDD